MIENLTLAQVLAGLTFLIAFSKGVDWILSPFKSRKIKDLSVEERFKKIENHQDNDNTRLAQLENDTKQILLSVNALLNHSIDNNHTEDLKKRKKDLEEYLIKR